MFDPKELKFTVEDEVKLHYKDFEFSVCDTPEDFEDFCEDVISQLMTIKEEIQENYDVEY